MKPPRNGRLCSSASHCHQSCDTTPSATYSELVKSSSGRFLVLALVAACALTAAGCTPNDVQPEPAPSSHAVTASETPEASHWPTSVGTEPDIASAFEQQLPLTGDFVSQAADTRGSVRIELRDDGSTWIAFTNFQTESGSDLRLYLSDGPLIQNEDGHWIAGPSSFRFEVTRIDGTISDQEVEVPGAWDMPEIQTLTIMNYAGDFPSFGSVALS